MEGMSTADFVQATENFFKRIYHSNFFIFLLEYERMAFDDVLGSV